MGQWGGDGEGEGAVSRSRLLGEVGWGTAKGMWGIVALSGRGWEISRVGHGVDVFWDGRGLGEPEGWNVRLLGGAGVWGL